MKQVSTDTRRKAKALRSNLTDAEAKLWQSLRRRQLNDLRFRRQVPIKGYIADFVCHEAKLVIELDGGQHAEAEVYDGYRTKVLTGEGYRVLRFWNNDVMTNFEGVLSEIARVAGDRTPSQTLPQSGGGLK
ncbi:MAG: endonuclease domain-containing protein [Pseudomonadota bacterium]